MMRLMILIGLVAATGCKKEPAPPATPPTAATPAPEAAPAPEAKVEPAPRPEPAAAPPPVATPSSQEALARAMRDVYCATRRADRSGLAKLYAGGGFTGSADFATAFAEARKADPAWAERALADAVTADCTLPAP